MNKTIACLLERFAKMEERENDGQGSEADAPSEYVAHTPNDRGIWQSMRDHEDGVTRLSEAFAAVFGTGEWGRQEGKLHDIGKYSDAFQAYLRACYEAERRKAPPPKKGVDHKTAGAWRAAKEMRNSLLGVVMLGHHGGLPSVAKFQDKLAKAAEIPGFETALRRATETVGPLQPLVPPDWIGKSELKAEFFCRMLYSCLVDADSLDTEAHFDEDKAALRGDATPLSRYRDDLKRSQEKLMEEARRKSSTVNDVRREVYEACLAAASRAPGVFRLTVPTGGGKTRSSLAFALEHALRHGMERVLYAIPYTSIIDQTVQEFRKIFGTGPDAPQVIEHHSALPEPKEESDEEAEGAEFRQRLACDNWDARLVVTTTVQLFESLFGRKPGRCRKVHRLAKSVIILDEVQTLPLPLLAPIIDGLNMLAAHFGTTVVLCTATQPAMEGNSPYLKGFPSVEEIVPAEMRNRHFQSLKRVEYRIEPESEPWTWDRAAEEMTGVSQCLAVVNTRKDALKLLDALEPEGPEGLFHLSTLLCGAHRKRVIDQVKERLTRGLPVCLVSTQVIEAGVDLDFPRVLRAIGPLDRIIQAAGRCNREGQLPGLGRMTVFYPADGSTPKGSYATALGEAKVYLKRDGIDLYDPELMTAYFRSLYGLVNTDERKINEGRKALDFPYVEEKFRMIDQDSVSVLVRYDPDAYEAILREAEFAGGMSRKLWRKAQPYVVSIPRWESRLKQKVIREIIPDQLYVWDGQYDDLRGITDETVYEPGDLVMG
jgi:CRISPR-associated endonuclease/helicase Cas3